MILREIFDLNGLSSFKVKLNFFCKKSRSERVANAGGIPVSRSGTPGRVCKSVREKSCGVGRHIPGPEGQVMNCLGSGMLRLTSKTEASSFCDEGEQERKR